MAACTRSETGTSISFLSSSDGIAGLPSSAVSSAGSVLLMSHLICFAGPSHSLYCGFGPFPRVGWAVIFSFFLLRTAVGHFPAPPDRSDHSAMTLVRVQRANSSCRCCVLVGEPPRSGPSSRPCGLSPTPFGLRAGLSLPSSIAAVGRFLFVCPVVHALGPSVASVACYVLLISFPPSHGAFPFYRSS